MPARSSSVKRARMHLSALLLNAESDRVGALPLHPWRAHLVQQFVLLENEDWDQDHHQLGDCPYVQHRLQLQFHLLPLQLMLQEWLPMSSHPHTNGLLSNQELCWEDRREVMRYAQGSFLDHQFVWQQRSRHHRFDQEVIVDCAQEVRALLGP